MALCEGCMRARSKLEDAHTDLIECKASEDAGTLMQAFDLYRQTRTSNVPFVVEGVAGHKGSAWPLLFEPSSITRCEGRIDAR
jgi:hypothetical protein